MFTHIHLTAGYFYAWMETIRREDETPRLIKFIPNFWYVLLEPCILRLTEVERKLLSVSWSAWWMWTRLAGWVSSVRLHRTSMSDPGSDDMSLTVELYWNHGCHSLTCKHIACRDEFCDIVHLFYVDLIFLCTHKKPTLHRWLHWKCEEGGRLSRIDGQLKVMRHTFLQTKGCSVSELCKCDNKWVLVKCIFTKASVDLRPVSAECKAPLGLQGAKWSDRLTLSPHCPGPHWSPKADLCTPPPSSLALPLNFALRCLVGCRTRLCCVSGGNASPLSTEQLFDDGPCCTSLWFQSLQRAGLHMGLACSHNGPKSQGSGLHGPIDSSLMIYFALRYTQRVEIHLVSP